MGVIFDPLLGQLRTKDAGGGGSGITRSVNVISTNTSAGSAASTDYVYLVDSASAVTVTLPTAVGNTNLYDIKRRGANNVSIATTSSQTIDGTAAPYVISFQYKSISLVSDGSNWNIM